MKKLFGTDGIRGIYGTEITGDIAYKLGNSLARHSGGGSIVAGRDTRLSGVELMKYLRKGVLDGGADLIDLGMVSTPIVSYVTEHIGADYGVAITASHNSKEYNGLKVFGADGAKIESSVESEIEEDFDTRIFVSKVRGKLLDGSSYIDEYKERLKSLFSTISGRNFGFDTTNGALSDVGSSVIEDVLSDAHIVNNQGDGLLINEGSGALHPEAVARIVEEHNLDAGFAFDGDGDRIVAVDEKGTILSGDALIYAIACYMKSMHKLSNNVVVGTSYTNLGVERALEHMGITLIRADVGDSNVAKVMREVHSSLGGERAGHIILSDYAPTGDGLLVALYLIKVMSETNKPLSVLASSKEYPARNFDIVTARADEILSDNDILAIKSDVETKLGGRGRVIMRSSGTEHKLRIMLECESMDDVDYWGSYIRDSIKTKYKIK